MREIATSVTQNRQTVSVYARFDAYARDSERTRAYSLEKISVKVATRLDDETDIGSSERRAWRTKLERLKNPTGRRSASRDAVVSFPGIR